MDTKPFRSVPNDDVEENVTDVHEKQVHNVRILSLLNLGIRKVLRRRNW